MEVTIKRAHRLVDDWNSKDLLLYFAIRWQSRTGREFLIPNDAWGGFQSRIKSFQRKTKLTNAEYKQFIDDVMDQLFIDPNYHPNFGCIVSEKILWGVVNVKKAKKVDWKALREEVYANSALYSALVD